VVGPFAPNRSLQPTPLSGRFLGVARRLEGFGLRVGSLRSSRGG